MPFVVVEICTLRQLFDIFSFFGGGLTPLDQSFTEFRDPGAPWGAIRALG